MPPFHGIVTIVSNIGPPTVFKANDENNTTFQLMFNQSLILQKNDEIMAKVIPEEANPHHLTITQFPLVLFRCDEATIKTKFYLTGLPKNVVDPLYERLTDLSRRNHNPDAVPNYLSDLATSWMRFRDNPDVLERAQTLLELGPDQTRDLLKWWYKKWTLRRLYVLGLTNSEIDPLLTYLSPVKIYTMCMDNPFKLPSVPLIKACAILQAMDREISPIEINCGQIVRKAYSYLESGWTSTPLWLLSKEFSTFHSLKEHLIAEYGVKIEHNCLYLPYPYRVELEITRYIEKQRDVDVTPVEVPSHEILSSEQLAAINGALSHPLSIITGPAGTGKTLVISEMVKILTQIPGEVVLVTSFTGKAVTRLKEVLKGTSLSVPPATMDRLIMTRTCQPTSVIIDEASMVTTELLYRFINAYQGDYRIILVGDINQLAPVGWGTLMAELMSQVPVYRLTVNHRILKPGSVILKNACDLLIPREFPLVFQQGPDFTQYAGGYETIEYVLSSLRQINVSKDRITIICPLNKHLKDLNTIFQRVFKEEVKDDSIKTIVYNRISWMVGDRVMMLDNNYQYDIMNGEEGILIDIKAEGLVVRFKETEFLFKFDKPKEEDSRELHAGSLNQSFAITVHKSQGSEYDYVIGYIPDIQGSFLTLNLLYTLLTRARMGVWLIGSNVSINNATTQKQRKRYDNLNVRLTKLFGPPVVNSESDANAGTNRNSTNQGYDEYTEEDYSEYM